MDLAIVNYLFIFLLPNFSFFRKYFMHAVMQLVWGIALHCQYLLKILPHIEFVYIHYLASGERPKNIIEVIVKSFESNYPINLWTFAHNWHPIALSNAVANHAWIGDHVKEYAFLKTYLECSNYSGGAELLPETSDLIYFVADVIFTF